MTKRLSLGKWVDGTFRLRVSLPGNDVDAALSPDQLAFDSTLDGYGLILQAGTFAIPGSMSNTALVTWPDLGYVPMVYIVFGSTKVRQWLKTTQNIDVRSTGLFGYGSGGATTAHYVLFNSRVV